MQRVCRLRDLYPDCRDAGTESARLSAELLPVLMMLQQVGIDQPETAVQLMVNVRGPDEGMSVRDSPAVTESVTPEVHGECLGRGTEHQLICSCKSQPAGSSVWETM